jgi:hypothetical protein
MKKMTTQNALTKVSNELTSDDWCMRPTDDINWTSLKGEIDISYAELVEVFGEPHGVGDEYKVDAEWAFEFNIKEEDSDRLVVATIYNYKDGKNYNGAEGLDVEDIRDWHIGGRSPLAVELIKKTIANHARNNSISIH